MEEKWVLHNFDLIEEQKPEKTVQVVTRRWYEMIDGAKKPRLLGTSLTKRIDTKSS